jgi:hypothetical protein
MSPLDRVVNPDNFILAIAESHPTPAALLAAVDRYREAVADLDEVPFVDGTHPPHFVRRVRECEAVLKGYAEPFSTRPDYPDEWR